MTTQCAAFPAEPISIGHRFPEKQLVLEPLRIEEYVTALGLEPDAEGWSPTLGSSVPPGYLMYVTTYGADPIHHAFGIDFRRAVYGGMDTEYFLPVRIGDTLRVSPWVSNVTTKETRNGSLAFIELTCEYLLADDRLAVRERSTTIQRGES